MPGSPTTPATWPRPVSTWASRACRVASSRARPTNGLSTRSQRSHPGASATTFENGVDHQGRCLSWELDATASRRAIPRTKRAVVSLHRICPGAACSGAPWPRRPRPPPRRTAPIVPSTAHHHQAGMQADAERQGARHTRSRRSWCTCKRRWSSNATRTARQASSSWAAGAPKRMSRRSPSWERVAPHTDAPRHGRGRAAPASRWYRLSSSKGVPPATVLTTVQHRTVTSFRSAPNPGGAEGVTTA